MLLKSKNFLFVTIGLTLFTGWVFSLIGLMKNQDSYTWLGIYIFWGAVYYFWISREEKKLKKLRSKLGFD